MNLLKLIFAMLFLYPFKLLKRFFNDLKAKMLKKANYALSINLCILIIINESGFNLVL